MLPSPPDPRALCRSTAEDPTPSRSTGDTHARSRRRRHAPVCRRPPQASPQPHTARRPAGPANHRALPGLRRAGRLRVRVAAAWSLAGPTPRVGSPPRSSQRVRAIARARSAIVGRVLGERRRPSCHETAEGVLRRPTPRTGRRSLATGTTVDDRVPNASDRGGIDGCLIARSKDVRGRTYTSVTPLRATGVAMPDDAPDTHGSWSSSIHEAAAFLLELEGAHLLPEGAHLLPEELNDDARRLSATLQRIAEELGDRTR